MLAESETAPVVDVDQPEITDPEADDLDGESCDDVDAVEEDSSLSLDVAFDIVKNERRRLLLQYLAEQDGPVALGELAEHIAAIENDKDVKAINSSERKRVYVGLYQCHLPKMDAADVIDSERNSNITLGENADQVMRYIDVEEESAHPWNQYYLVLSVVGVLSVAVDAAVGLGTVGTLGIGVVLLALLGTAIAHSTSA